MAKKESIVKDILGLSDLIGKRTNSRKLLNKPESELVRIRNNLEHEFKRIEQAFMDF